MSKKHVLGLIASFITFALIFVSGEVFTRIFLKRFYDTALLEQNLDSANIKSLIMPVGNPNILYRLKSNLNATFHESTVVTDESGTRTGLTPIPAPDNAIRLAVVGDSTSFGWRVNYMDTYGEKTRSLLEEKFEAPVELRNYSVPGYNASQAYYSFEAQISNYRPDLLIVHHDHNDSQATGWGYPPNYIPPDYGDNFVHSALFKFILRQTKSIINKWNFNSKMDDDRNEAVENYYVSGPLYDAHIESRRKLAALTSAHSIPAVVLIFNANVVASENWENQDTYLRLHKQLYSLLDDMGFYVLDLYPEYQGILKELAWKDMNELWINQTDLHPNPDGHNYIANFLTNYITSEPELLKVFSK